MASMPKAICSIGPPVLTFVVPPQVAFFTHRIIRWLVCAWLALFVSAASSLWAAANPTFATGVIVGAVSIYDISEASGLLASRQNPGVLWTHNDSGYRGSIFALSTNGTYLARHQTPNVYSGNFEDIAFGPGPLPHFNYIYLGDIGDNNLNRGSIRVFRFPEPSAYPYQSNNPPILSIPGAQEITLYYPSGAFNCEGLMVDPVTGDLFLATKQTNNSHIYRATRAELESGEATLTFIRDADFKSVSAADISADGSLIALRRGTKGGLWVRATNESVGDALARAPITIPISTNEPNGEAIAFNANSSGYYTTSEGYLQPIYYFARTDTTPGTPRVFVAPGQDWHVEDTDLPLSPEWRTSLIDDWRSGPAPFGYGSGEQTTTEYGSPDDKYTTTHFRKTFVRSGGAVTNLTLRLCFNDGVVVYLNGTEILRYNLNPGAVQDDFATASNAEFARTWFSFPVNAALLHAGTNVLAVEVHLAALDSPSLNFDAQLVEARTDAPARFSAYRRIGTNLVMNLTGPNGKPVHVESSTNLVGWNFFRDIVMTNSAGAFTNASSGPRRFYRIRP